MCACVCVCVCVLCVCVHAYVEVCVQCGKGMFLFAAAVIEGMYKDRKFANMEVQYLNFTRSEGTLADKPLSQLRTKKQPLPTAQRKVQMENQLLQELKTKITSQPIEKQPLQKLQATLLPQPKEKHMPLTKCAEDKVDPPFKKRQWNIPPGTIQLLQSICSALHQLMQYFTDNDRKWNFTARGHG